MVITNILFNFYLWNTFVHALICLVAWQRLLFEPFRLGCLTSKSNRLASRSDFFLLFKPLKSLKDQMLCQNLACPSLSKPVLVLHLRTGISYTKSGQLVPGSTRTQVNPYPQTLTGVISYPCRLIPTSTRIQFISHPRQLVVGTTRTQDNSYSICIYVKIYFMQASMSGSLQMTTKTIEYDLIE